MIFFAAFFTAFLTAFFTAFLIAFCILLAFFFCFRAALNRIEAFSLPPITTTRGLMSFGARLIFKAFWPYNCFNVTCKILAIRLSSISTRLRSRAARAFNCSRRSFLMVNFVCKRAIWRCGGQKQRHVQMNTRTQANTHTQRNSNNNGRTDNLRTLLFSFFNANFDAAFSFFIANFNSRSEVFI